MTLKELIEKCGGSTGNAIHEWCDFRDELCRLAQEMAFQSWRSGFSDDEARIEDAKRQETKLFHKLFDLLYN